MDEENLVENDELQHPKKRETGNVGTLHDERAQRVIARPLLASVVGRPAQHGRKAQANEDHDPKRKHFFAEMAAAGLAPHPTSIQVVAGNCGDARCDQSRPPSPDAQGKEAEEQDDLSDDHRDD